MGNKKKIVFFGTPEHAKNVLEGFFNSEKFEIVGVVTQPDKPVGRKKIYTETAVKQYARDKKIPVLTPEKFSGEVLESSEKWLKEKNADFFVVVAYGVLVPQSIIDIPGYGAFNLHFSLLPKYRGASPIQSALLDGEKFSGISIFKLCLEMDAGEIFIQEKIRTEEKNHLELWNEMTAIGTEKFLELCDGFEKFSGAEQDESAATFCGKFTKADGEIFLSGKNANSAQEILQKFRGFFLWPGIFFFDDSGKRVKVLDIQELSGETTESYLEEFSKKKTGSIFFDTLQKKLLLKTTTDFLELKTLQKEGKKPVSGGEYL